MIRTFCFIAMTVIALMNGGFWMWRSAEKYDLQQQLHDANEKIIYDEKVIDSLDDQILDAKKKREDAKRAKFLHTSFIQSELGCLADNIYFEAGAEPEEGQLAVATVTMNRLAKPEYPKSVCGVVHERHIKKDSDTIVCMFSWVCKPKRPVQSSIYHRLLGMAKDVYLKHKRNQDVSDATLYHADYVEPPDWANPDNEVTQIGKHIFYKE